MADNKKPWSASVGSHGGTVTVKERGFRGTLYLQWYENRKTRKKSLGYKLRTTDGRIIQKRKKQAIRAAEDHRATLLGEASTEERVIELTLQRAFELFFRIPDGHYAAETRNYREVRRYADRIEQLLGPDTLWANLVEGTPAKRLWRQLAKDHLDTGIGGHRSAERTVGVLFLLADWLVETHGAPSLDRRQRWMRSLREEWTQITGREPSVDTPRFSSDEFARLDRHRHKLDPRADLLFDLAWGKRAGQYLRLYRSQVDLEQSPDQPWGSVYVEGRGNKRAGRMHLTESQFRHLTHALAEGYLSDFERRYRSRELDDYCLFSGGQLIQGKANPDYAQQPLNRTWVGDRFLELEALAGIAHRYGRGWNGVRRTAADLAEDVTDDARVLRKEGGWTNDETRRGYQDEARPEVLRHAAEVRAQIRDNRTAPSSGDGASTAQNKEGREPNMDLDDVLELVREMKARGLDPRELLQTALDAQDTEEGV